MDGLNVFSNLFGRRGNAGHQPETVQTEAVEALHALDSAIKSMHPNRYGSVSDAAEDMRRYLSNINTFLGRPETERCFPIDYDAVVRRLDFFATRGLLEPVVEAATSLPVMEALMKSTLHEYKMRTHNARHDGVNLGAEVKALTVGLLDFLNRVGTTGPQPSANGPPP